MNFKFFTLPTYCLLHCCCLCISLAQSHSVPMDKKVPTLTPEDSAKFLYKIQNMAKSSEPTLAEVKATVDSPSSSSTFASDMATVLKALYDLPETLKNAKNVLNDPATASSTDVDLATHFRPARHPALSSTVALPSLYMTGSPRLDKILNCPCQQSQLTLLGVQGYSFPTTYYEPSELEYGIGSHFDYGYHQTPSEGWSKLQQIGESKGETLAHVLKHVLGAPARKLTLLQPLVVGASHTAAKATNGFARLTSKAAYVLPMAAERKAEAFERMAGKAGHVGGVVFRGLSKLATSIGAAKTKVHDGLPYKFAVLNHAADRVTSNIDAFLDHF